MLGDWSLWSRYAKLSVVQLTLMKRKIAWFMTIMQKSAFHLFYRLRRLTDETPAEMKYRKAREELNNWCSQFWAKHNTLFEKKRAEFIAEVRDLFRVCVGYWKVWALLWNVFWIKNELMLYAIERFLSTPVQFFSKLIANLHSRATQNNASNYFLMNGTIKSSA